MKKSDYLATSEKFSLRTKFVKQVNDENLLDKMRETFSFILRKREPDALDLLWNLTYNPEQTFELLGYKFSEECSSDFYLRATYLPKEFITPFRNELRFQYIKKRDPNFSRLKVPQECVVPLREIQNLEMGAVIAAVINSRCVYQTTYATAREIERCLFLLRSPIERNFFGGLRALGFSILEAEYLKPLAKKVAHLLEGYYNILQDSEKEEEPLVKFNEETSSSMKTYMAPDLGEMTLELVTTHIEEIENFLNACDKLESLEFNPQEVIKYSKIIREIF